MVGTKHKHIGTDCAKKEHVTSGTVLNVIY